MSSGSSKDVQVEEIFTAHVDSVSSVDPPREEWSSLESDNFQENEKILLFEEGQYHPGSGEICAKYITQSDSAVLRHPLYWYPAVDDPGIKKALLYPIDKIEYPEDGQELYLDTCKEMNICPVKIFHKGLLEEDLDLRYYGVNPSGLRAMCIALRHNRFVQTINLTDNFLTNDSCFHIGDMLLTNTSLVELNLSGCRIGLDGLKNLIQGLKLNRGLKILNLDRNQLGDDGGEALGVAMCEGVDLETISLCDNSLEDKTLTEFRTAFSYNLKLKSLDLSWNKLSKSQYAFQKCLEALSEMNKFEGINLSWNGLHGERVCAGISALLTLPNLKFFDLSHNMLSSEISEVIPNLKFTKKLNTLDLSFNPISKVDAKCLVDTMMLRNVKLKTLYMENVEVSSAFVVAYNQLMHKKPNVVVTYGNVKERFVSKSVDMKDVIINRIEYLLKKPKKHKVDIAIVVLKNIKNNMHVISTTDFAFTLEEVGGYLDEDLISGLAEEFPSSKVSKKSKLIDMVLLAEFLKRKWPERHLPPTPPPPPPEPEPVPEPEPERIKKKSGKGKKKKE